MRHELLEDARVHLELRLLGGKLGAQPRPRACSLIPLRLERAEPSLGDVLRLLGDRVARGLVIRHHCLQRLELLGGEASVVEHCGSHARAREAACVCAVSDTHGQTTHVAQAEPHERGGERALCADNLLRWPAHSRLCSRQLPAATCAVAFARAALRSSSVGGALLLWSISAARAFVFWPFASVSTRARALFVMPAVVPSPCAPSSSAATSELNSRFSPRDGLCWVPVRVAATQRRKCVSLRASFHCSPSRLKAAARSALRLR